MEDEDYQRANRLENLANFVEFLWEILFSLLSGLKLFVMLLPLAFLIPLGWTLQDVWRNVNLWRDGLFTKELRPPKKNERVTKAKEAVKAAGRKLLKRAGMSGWDGT